jgi:hypothetical protein
MPWVEDPDRRDTKIRRAPVIKPEPFGSSEL